MSPLPPELPPRRARAERDGPMVAWIRRGEITRMDDRTQAELLTKMVLSAIARLHFMVQLLTFGVALLVIAFLIHVLTLILAR